mmetsp:Transcript_35277/g.41165  ORF Transcript_35277/g.41165 Transcript_35277/m.41165 type:complete len:82 (+) Transcript_35277:203-448(+)
MTCIVSISLTLNGGPLRRQQRYADAALSVDVELPFAEDGIEFAGHHVPQFPKHIWLQNHEQLSAKGPLFGVPWFASRESFV